MFCSRFRCPFPRAVSGFHQITRTAHYDRHHPCIFFGHFLPSDREPFLRQKKRTRRSPRPFHTHFGVLAFSGRGLASTRCVVSLAVHLATFQCCGSCRVNTQDWVSILSWDFPVCCGLFFLLKDRFDLG